MKSASPILSIIVPALNEERAIAQTIKGVQEVMLQLGIGHELLLFDDGSTDATGAIMDGVVRNDVSGRTRVIHHPKPWNIGGVFLEGVRKTNGKYVLLVPGDNETSREALANVIKKIGHADVIISYTVNPEVRSLLRRAASYGYVLFLNTVFGLSLRYFNGTFVIRRDLLLQLPAWTPGFAFASEIIIQLIKAGASYQEIPVPLQPRLTGKSKAASFTNLFLVLRTILKLIWRVYFGKKLVLAKAKVH